MHDPPEPAHSTVTVIAALTWIASAAAALSVAIFASRAGLEYDEAVYLGIADQIRIQGCPIRPEGPGSVYLNNPPLAMAVSALFGGVAPGSVAWARAVHWVIWVVPMVGVSVSLSRRSFGPMAGLLCALALCSMPHLLSEAALAKLDIPLATLAIAMWWLLKRGVSGPWLGVVAAMATATRYQGVMLGAVAFVVLTLDARRKGSDWRNAVRGRAVWSLAGAAVGGLVWTILSTACGGGLVNAVLDNLGRLAEQSDEPWFHRSTSEYLGSLLVTWVGPFALVATVGGLVMHRKHLRADTVTIGLIAWVVVNLVFCASIGLKAERYFAPAMPPLCVLSSAIVADDIAGRTAQLLRRWVPLGAALAAVASLSTLVLRLPDGRAQTYYAEAARRVVAVTAPEDRVMVTQVQLAYLAKRHYYVSLFERDPQVVLDWLKDPEANIHAIASDDRILLYHPQMPVADKRRIQRYVRTHFERRMTDVEHLVLWVRRINDDAAP